MNSMFLVLLLALKGTTDFKETKLICKDVSYTYTTEGSPDVYIVANSKDYLTKFTNIDDLQKEIDKQCEPQKKAGDK